MLFKNTSKYSMQTVWDFAMEHTDEQWLLALRHSMALDSDCAVPGSVDCRRYSVVGGDDGSCVHGVAEIYLNQADRYLACRHRRN